MGMIACILCGNLNGSRICENCRESEYDEEHGGLK